MTNTPKSNIKRNKMNKIYTSALTAIAALAFCLPACADQTGKWTLYQSFSDITEISPAGTCAFAVASGSLFAYNTATGETTVYDKTNSLSDADICHTAWSAAARRLVIAYEDSNIDLMTTTGEVTNVPDLYQKTTTKDKTVNHICIDGAYAYLSLGFGVLKLDIRRGVVADTYQLDFNVDYSYTRDGYLYAASKENGIYRGRLTDNLLDKNTWQRIGDYTASAENRLNIQDTATGLWWTKSEDGKLTCYTTDAEGNREYKTEGILPEGPASNRFYRLYMHGGKLYGVAGAWSQELNGQYEGEVHVWDGNKWSEFEQPSQKTLGHKSLDWLCMDFDPKKEGHVMVGAKSGLYEFQDGLFVNHYNFKNSPIKALNDNVYYAVVGSVKYDSDGNLWLLNSLAENPILKYTQSDDQWTTLKHTEFGEESYRYDLKSLFTSPTTGLMWFVNNYWLKTRLYAYNPATDEMAAFGPTYVNEDGTEVTPNYCFCATEDKNGNVWIGTSSGPLYLTPADMQSGIFTQHKVARNDGTNLADYLLANFNTRSIAVDGANRKWIGTQNGVFLISDDCNTQVQHFTTENSPLLSNTVTDIKVDPNSNMVYFATDKGLCSYASDATQPADNMTKDNVYAYPNPVRPDYTGPITIVGLSYNSDVKIVTSNGVLVNKGRSTGGSYQWDGCDLKGRHVASGVYMVEAATENGEKGTVCKVAVIR